MTNSSPTPVNRSPLPPLPAGSLADTESIAEFMDAFGQEVLDTPALSPDERTRVLRAQLVLEEAFELAAALGLLVSVEGSPPAAVNPKAVTVSVDPDADYDMVETLDALGDLNVVVKGSGLALGLPVDAATLDHIMPSNMSKLGPDGKPIYREDGKILKGPDFFEPQGRLAALLLSTISN